MPQSLSQKAVNNFVRGLITEAGELTFPEGASVDELNCELRRDGSRRRRLGLALESNHVLSSFTISDSEIVHTGDWLNVGGTTELEFLVVQKGSNLYFYNKTELPYSSQGYTDYIDLTAHEYAGSSGAETAKCQFASLNGNLIVSSEAINTIYVTFDSASVGNEFSSVEISFKVRDFDWQGDTDTYKTAGATDAARTYDTKNAGWVDTKGEAARTTWSAANSGNYPPLTHPWFAGKDSSGDFDAAEWDKVFAGNTLTSNGHYILDFFSKVRSGLTTETINTRFKTVASFGGRVFYSGIGDAEHSGHVLFSKIVEGVTDLGICHQVNDPTAEYLSDLLDSDGGIIVIPDAVNIQLIYPYQTALFVFAENGVWQISGVDGVFRASEYSINRVSKIGILNPQTFISAEGTPFWWSRFGIHTLGTDSVSGQGQETNISLTTIQTFWDQIDTSVKRKVTAVYDNVNKKIYWAYPNANETVDAKLNNFLILDLALQAFVPWSVPDQTSSTDCVVGLAFYSGFGADTLELDVTTNGGLDDVVTSAGDDVVSSQISGFATGDPSIVLLVRDGTTNKMTMASFSSTSFLDWGDTNYSSFAVTGYDFVGDLLTKKNAPYIAVYSRLTEEGFTGNETDGYEPIRPSSLLVSAAWDFKDTFSSTQQAYRLKQPVVVNPSDLSNFSYPEDVITTRLKIRGHGRSMRIKYESEQGKDFILLGWGMIQGRNTRF
jgi:hypothetical protein